MKDKVLEGLINNDEIVVNTFQAAIHDAWNLINVIFKMKEERREIFFGTSDIEEILNLDVDDVITKIFGGKAYSFF